MSVIDYAKDRPAAAGTGAAPLLQMRGIVKSFPGVKAVRDGQLELERGQVVALLGENGAGKSTLMKILGGAHRADAGEVLMDGKPVDIRSPIDAQRAGIAMIYQELDLVPSLTVRENIFLGRERTRAGMFVSAAAERRQALELFARLKVHVNPEALVSSLSVAQQQVVAIAKALSTDARVVVMDEPSAPLTPSEVERLFVIIRDLQAQGIGVIYISHRLDEIFTISDRVVVMRDGSHVASKPIGDLNRSRLIELMVGRPLDQEFPRDRSITVGEERLVVRNLSRGRAVRDVSFSIRRGEIVGLTGLVGAGRTEVARLIFGADPHDAGTISLDGRPLRIGSPRDAIKAGISLLTEDRKQQGLVLAASCLENFGLPNFDKLSRFGFVAAGRERSEFDGFIQSLKIKLANRDVLAKTLSGGNQQKVVLAKWLEANAEVVIFDEPTRGIDVGAKYEIYLLMNALAKAGKAILMISSELPEVLGMSDRVLVMREGQLTKEFASVEGLTQEQVMAAAVR